MQCRYSSLQFTTISIGSGLGANLTHTMMCPHALANKKCRSKVKLISTQVVSLDVKGEYREEAAEMAIVTCVLILGFNSEVRHVWLE